MLFRELEEAKICSANLNKTCAELHSSYENVSQEYLTQNAQIQNITKYFSI